MRIDKNGEKVTKTISWILKLIDSARFTESSLSNLVKNFSEEIHKIKLRQHHKKMRNLWNYIKKYAIVFLNTEILKII